MVVAALSQTGRTCAGVVSLTLVEIFRSVPGVAVSGGYRVLPATRSSVIIVVPC